MKLIDADALMDDIKETIENSGCVNHEGEILDCIAYADEIDAVPVVRGEWEITDAYPHWMCCSVCHKAVVRNIEVIERYEIPTSYCPNCGAKMEGKP